MENWGNEPAKEMADITLKDFEALIEKAFKLRGEIDAKELEVEALKGELKSFQTQILGYMQEFKKDNYKTQFGQVIKKKNWSVTTPKTPEDKAAFFDYLKSKGIFEEMVTVHSKTLNSFVQQEIDAAKESGDIDFKVPGIEEPKVVETISFRK